MAMCISSFASSSLNLLGKNVFKQLVVNTVRQLYAPASLGIPGYLNARDYVKSQFANVEHLFFQKMKEFATPEQNQMIFTEDLKTILHLIEKKPEDLNLLYKILIKFRSQHDLRFGTFVFGTVVMRAFYFLDEPELALKAFKDPELDGFFDQLMSYQILMDMLYNHGRYSDVRDVYDIVKKKNINGIVHPRNPFIIVTGACFKENTDESLNYATALFKDVKTRDFAVPRRAITFFGMLALNRNKPSMALEATSLTPNMRYIDIRCIKLKAYAELKRIDEIVINLRESLQNESVNNRKQMYFTDAIEKIEELIVNEKLDETHDLVTLLKQIKLHDYVQTGTLNEHVCTPITIVRFTSEQKPWQKQQNENKFQSYHSNDRNMDRNKFYRPGLKNMI